MASVYDFVGDFMPRERELLDSNLRPGEHVRWATRPLCRAGAKELATFAFVELISAAFLVFPCILCYILLVHPPTSSPVLQVLAFAFFALFFLLGLWFATLPLREYRRRRRTLYLLTNHRALVLTPGEILAYPLNEHMLHSRICRPGGSGDLIFEVLAQGRVQQGFTHLPNLQQAQRELNAAINALLDAAEQHIGSRAQNS